MRKQNCPEESRCAEITLLLWNAFPVIFCTPTFKVAPHMQFFKNLNNEVIYTI